MSTAHGAPTTLGPDDPTPSGTGAMSGAIPRATPRRSAPRRGDPAPPALPRGDPACIRCTHPTDPRASSAGVRRSCGVRCRISCTMPTAASQLVGDAPSDAPLSTPDPAPRTVVCIRCTPPSPTRHPMCQDRTRRVMGDGSGPPGPRGTARCSPAWPASSMTAIPPVPAALFRDVEAPARTHGQGRSHPRQGTRRPGAARRVSTLLASRGAAHRPMCGRVA